MSHASDGDILTTFQAARLCGVSHKSIERWIDAGYLRGFRTPGGHRRVHPDGELAAVNKSVVHGLPSSSDRLAVFRRTGPTSRAMSNRVNIVPYDPNWPRRFDDERCVLAAVFEGSDVTIEHVGSTAVPGLGAKPVIDVMVGVPILVEVEDRIPALEAAGHEFVNHPLNEIVTGHRIRCIAFPGFGRMRQADAE